MALGLLTVAASLAVERLLPAVCASGVGAHRLPCSAACGIFPDQRSNLCPLQCTSREVAGLNLFERTDFSFRREVQKWQMGPWWLGNLSRAALKEALGWLERALVVKETNKKRSQTQN